jgi:hypothetical protein
MEQADPWFPDVQRAAVRPRVHVHGMGSVSAKGKAGTEPIKAILLGRTEMTQELGDARAWRRKSFRDAWLVPDGT